MRDSNDKLLAKLLLQGLITPEEVAKHFKLDFSHFSIIRSP